MNHFLYLMIKVTLRINSNNLTKLLICIFCVDSSDSELEGMEITVHSESENEWDEYSSSNESANEENNTDEEMSS